MRSIRSAVLPALAGLACLAAAPAVAGAAPKQAPKVAYFKAKLTGTQVTDWRYSRPATPCLPHQHADGTATIAFASSKAVKIVATEGKGSPVGKLTKGRPFVATTTGSPLLAAPELTMTGTNEVGETDPTCEGVADGGAHQDIGCAKTTGEDLGFQLQFLKRNRLTLTGRAGEWQGPRGGTQFLSTAFDNCPYWIGGPGGSTVVSEGQIAPVTVTLPEKQLFDAGRRTFKLEGSDGLAPGGASQTFSGTVKTTWTLTLTRTAK